METQQTMPPLDTDLSTIDTSFQLLADGIYDLRVDKAEIKPTSKGDGKFISLELATIGPATSQKGEQLGPGIRVFDQRNLNPTGKATWNIVTRNVAELVQGAKLTGATLNNTAQWVPTLMGRVVRAKVGYKPESGQYKAKNVIQMYLK